MLTLPFITFFSINTLLLASVDSQLPSPHAYAQHTMPLGDRYPNQSVNEILKDNILLNVAYLKGDIKSNKDINWERVRKPTHFQFILHPNQTFSFHEDILPEYQGKVTITSHSHFNYQDGYKSDGYLYGDGVCHLASLLNWTARDAGLEVKAPTNHDFMPISDIPKEYGVAIFYLPGQTETNAKQNLYITNNKSKDITFDISASSDKVGVQIIE